MASGTVKHEFGPGDKVWVIYNQAADFQKTSKYSRSGYPPRLDGAGVKEGKVVYFRTDVLLTETKMWYGINLKGTDTTRDFHVEDVFGSLSEALVEYEYRLTGDVNTCTAGVNKVIQYSHTSTKAAKQHFVFHALNTVDVEVAVYNTQNKKVLPNEVQIVDKDSVVVDLGDQIENVRIIVFGATCIEPWTKDGATYEPGTTNNPCVR